MNSVTTSFNDIPGYLVSNENQRWATHAISNLTNVLTVAGSGDQALFYKLAGAKIIHTYDITRNAKVIQDIKTSAIQTLNFLDYANLIEKLYYCENILALPEMKKVAPQLPDDTKQILQAANNKYMFSAGLSPINYQAYQLGPNEYPILQKYITGPFIFTHCALDRLCTKLRMQYDIINISNIFDFDTSAVQQANILHDLIPFVSVGGRIIYLPQMQRFDYSKVKLNNGDMHLQYEKTITDKTSNTTMILFQRTR